MRIAVINEGSTKHRNADMMRVLSGFDHQIINVGMKNSEGEPDLNYLETGFLSALVLGLKQADLVVGGCGTGQGYMNAALQFPNVFCGLLLDPVDAWLYARVNAGNCISLALNKGYGGLGADINLSMIMEQLLNTPFGGGYPPARGAIQAAAREQLQSLSANSHLPMEQIMNGMDKTALKNALCFPGVMELVHSANDADDEVRPIKNVAIRLYTAIKDER